MFCVSSIGKYTMLKMRSQDFEELFLFKYNIIPQKNIIPFDYPNLLIGNLYLYVIKIVRFIENIYLCFVFTPKLQHEVVKCGDRHIDNGVFLRFDFDRSKSSKNF